ncbi:Lumazine binding domain [Fragilaria crotonensis]|nr:Lumazine binding domain [Fragilaria crotonensis]
MGKVVSLEERDDMILWDGSKGKGTEIVVEANVVMDGAYLGCSICVSGVCLTATELDGNTFKAGLAPETLRRTYLGTLTAGMR